MNKINSLKRLQAVVVSFTVLFILACGQITSVAPTLTVNPTSTIAPAPENINEDNRHVEGDFSYIPPSDWQIVEFPGAKYKMVKGKEEAGFSPNLNFVDETYTGSLDSYVSANLEAINNYFVNVNIISQENFKTNDGEIIIKVVTENTQNEKRLHQTFYFFDGGNKKFVITYTRLPDTGEEYDILIDQSVKTFRIEK